MRNRSEYIGKVMETSNSQYHDCTSFMHWYWNDLKSKPLMSVKLIMFFFYGATLVILNYNVVHMKSLGITVEEMSFILSLQPLGTSIAVPLSGALADKMGNFKALLAGSIISLGFTGLAFLAIPPGRVTIDLSETIDLYLTCGQKGVSSHIYRSPSSGVCEWSSRVMKEVPKIYECGFLCPTNHNETIERNSTSGTYSLLAPFEFKPSSDIHLSCEKEVCIIDKTSSHKNSSGMHFEFNTNFSSKSDIYDFKRPSNSGILYNGQGVSYKCASVGGCTTSCRIVYDRNSSCTNTDFKHDIYPTKVFVIYLIARIVQSIVISATCVLTEGAILAVVAEHKGDLGLQRLWSSLGCMLLAPVVGLLADHFHKNDFRPIYYSFFGMCLLCALVVSQIDLRFKKPARKLTRKVKKLILRSPVITFFVVMLITGILHGFLENYLFWYLEDIGASKALFGLIIFVAVGTGIPFLIFSSILIKWFGHVNVLLVGFSAYCWRFIAYYFLTDPAYALGIEVFESLTNSLTYTVVFTYISYHSTHSTLTTMQAIMGSIHWGLGRTGGSLLGVVMLRFMSLRQCFLWLGIFTLIFTPLYALFYHCYVKMYDIPPISEEYDDPEEEDCIMSYQELH